MLTDATQFFERYFPLLTKGKIPYPWQRELYNQLIRGDVPDSLRLPTGAGKTTILPLWLLALAWTCATGPGVRLPRRLVWVVNRRVVVDQATDEAKSILDALTRLNEGNPHDDLTDALRTLSGSDRLLAVSTLRGERADNREWSRDPSVAAIIVGTVDMVGSRLLFRGYGDGRYRRPYHAGLLGVDALIVNDESHLSPAFARLLLGVREAQTESRKRRNFHVMVVSATERALGDNPFQHSLEEDLKVSERFRSVYDAEKRLWLEESPDNQAAARRLVALALERPAPRTIVFVEQPEKALETARQIEKAVGASRVALLTGTMRGHERDSLTQNGVFQAFQGAAVPAEPIYLVTTSAGEVGVNISGERLVTMLSESDHLLQRFGRLNRFGDQEGAAHSVGEAHVVFVEPKEKEADTALSRTLDYLRGLPLSGEGWGDISCRALDERPAPEGTASAGPAVAPLRPWLLDMWAQTSVPSHLVPPVEPWLHGKQDDKCPETTVAWRAEVAWLAKEGVDKEDRRRALEGYRVLARERLAEPSRRVKEKLGRIAETTPDKVALWVSPDGDVEPASISKLASEKQDLRYGTVLLPTGCGGLVRGMFSEESGEPDADYDVADEGVQGEAERRRYIATGIDDEWQWRRAGNMNYEEEAGPDPNSAAALRRFADERELGKATVIPIPTGEETDGAPANVLILFRAKPALKARIREVDLDEHCEAVARLARSLGSRLLDGAATEWLVEAARLHDRGKSHKLWQESMGGDVVHPKAKTVGPGTPQQLAGFRHELHSLVLARKGTPCDPVLHLIGSHHGWGRPNWEARAYDRGNPKPSEDAALEAARRFGEMQAQWGHWGLAYLEAILKAADGMASAEDEDA